MIAAIMAGGRGLRLHPLTLNTPKPMLKVGGRPMLESLINNLRVGGCTLIYLCVGYRANVIEDYFGNGEDFGVSITYIHETEPQGTAGSLRHVDSEGEPFIVVNADIVTDISYNDLMNTYCIIRDTSDAQALMCTALYQHQVPFGVIETNDGFVSSIEEKPIKNFEVNAGIYVLPPFAPGFIPDAPFDMPILLGLMAVKTYPIQGYWQDVGHFESLARAHINWEQPK